MKSASRSSPAVWMSFHRSKVSQDRRAHLVELYQITAASLGEVDFTYEAVGMQVRDLSASCTSAVTALGMW
jgi:hypothetical protein